MYAVHLSREAGVEPPAHERSWTWPADRSRRTRDAAEQGPRPARRRRARRRRRHRRAQHAQARAGARRRTDGPLQARGQQGGAARRHGRRRRRRDRPAGRGPRLEDARSARGSSRPGGCCCATPGRPGSSSRGPAPTPAVLAYMDSMIGIFRAGGLSADLTHHVDARDGQPPARVHPGTVRRPRRPPIRIRRRRRAELAARYPHIAELATAAAHDEASVGGRAATTSSSSSSPWTSSWTASNACAARLAAQSSGCQMSVRVWSQGRLSGDDERIPLRYGGNEPDSRARHGHATRAPGAVLFTPDRRPQESQGLSATMPNRGSWVAWPLRRSTSSSIAIARSSCSPTCCLFAAERLAIIRDQVWGAPDLVARCCRPAPEQRDRGEKLGWYRQYGVRECWLVDPHQEQVTSSISQARSGRTSGQRRRRDPLVGPPGARTTAAAVFSRPPGSDLDFRADPR